MFIFEYTYKIDDVYFTVVDINGQLVEISARTKDSTDVPLSELEKQAVAAIRAAVERGEFDEAILIERGKARRSVGPMLAEVKAEAVARINREAGEMRARHITLAAGQEGTYLEKGGEARAWLADPDPNPNDYPYLVAEAVNTGSTLAEVAVLVDAARRTWTHLNAEIEGRRRGALTAVEKASTASEVEAAFPVDWPS